jgi:hypothetical protein
MSGNYTLTLSHNMRYNIEKIAKMIKDQVSADRCVFVYTALREMDTSENGILILSATNDEVLDVLDDYAYLWSEARVFINEDGSCYTFCFCKNGNNPGQVDVTIYNGPRDMLDRYIVTEKIKIVSDIDKVPMTWSS